MRKTNNTQKRLKGTAQPVRLDPECDAPGLTSLPDPPSFLSETGREIYSQIGQSLMTRNVLNEFTLHSWVMFCQYYSIWYDYYSRIESIDDMINKDGRRKAMSPEYRIAEAAGEKAHKLLSDFGMTPIAMTRIAALVGKPGKVDEYQEFLNGKGN
jgi:P27 family predicted phage terminase small subunit